MIEKAKAGGSKPAVAPPKPSTAGVNAADWRQLQSHPRVQGQGESSGGQKRPNYEQLAPVAKKAKIESQTARPQQQVPQQQPSLKCPHCDRRFNSERGVQQHIKDKHTT